MTDKKEVDSCNKSCQISDITVGCICCVMTKRPVDKVNIRYFPQCVFFYEKVEQLGNCILVFDIFLMFGIIFSKN